MKSAIRNCAQPVLRFSTFALSGLLALTAASNLLAQEFKSGIKWPEPPVVNPGNSTQAPSDAIVLFDGKNLDAFNNAETWKVENGVATVGKKSIDTKQGFGSCQIHLEFRTPEVVKGKGQGRGNSGVYIMCRYEVQILDSFENKTYFDGQCGAVYKQQPPTVNACRGPGKWQTYDIIFTAPKFGEDKKLISPAFVTVLHNGVVIHNHFKLHGGTSWSHRAKYTAHPEKLPLRLQNHGNPIQFRNIWVRENIARLQGTPPTKEELEKMAAEKKAKAEARAKRQAEKAKKKKKKGKKEAKNSK